MASFGFPGSGRCPRCGASRGRGSNTARRQQVTPAAPAQAAAANPGCTEGCGTPTASQELYTGTLPVQDTVRTCCDPYCGCRQFAGSTRNDFWPAFAHPRWLPCDMLYSGARR